jgi:hypothetical protein
VSRQTEPGVLAAGIGALRLDPAQLPARYAAPDRGADGGQRSIDLFADRVVIRRTTSGARMKLQLPVSAYRGVVVRLSGEALAGDAVEVVMVHRDPALSVPLMAADGSDDVVADWQRWGQALGLPLLVEEADGSMREAFPRLGAVMLGTPGPRRRRRSTLKDRRPSALMRRKATKGLAGQPVHQEREIIARN